MRGGKPFLAASNLTSVVCRKLSNGFQRELHTKCIVVIYSGCDQNMGNHSQITLQSQRALRGKGGQRLASSHYSLFPPSTTVLQMEGKVSLCTAAETPLLLSLEWLLGGRVQWVAARCCLFPSLLPSTCFPHNYACYICLSPGRHAGMDVVQIRSWYHVFECIALECITEYSLPHFTKQSQWPEAPLILCLGTFYQLVQWPFVLCWKKTKNN